jgi:hypothetical protein
MGNAHAIQIVIDCDINIVSYLNIGVFKFEPY